MNFDFNWALGNSAFSGHLDCMQQIKEWGGGITTFYWSLISAASGGNPDSIRLIKKWGAINYDEALNFIINGNHSIGMEHYSFWDIIEVYRPLTNVKIDYFACIRFLKSWGGVDRSKNARSKLRLTVGSRILLKKLYLRTLYH